MLKLICLLKGISMQFDNIPKGLNRYLNNVLNIIRDGIGIEKANFNIKDNENKKNQVLTDSFNIIGTQNASMWIGVQKEHIGLNSFREDIYFYLNDDFKTRIFYVEGKRIPKSKSLEDEDYVNGLSVTGSPCGGIERFILGKHGTPDLMTNYGMIGYIESKAIEDWKIKVNDKISSIYPKYDGTLKNTSYINEFLSSHFFDCHIKTPFNIHHFWIDLTTI